jgi:AcrR family transcriptional regulator
MPRAGLDPDAVVASAAALADAEGLDALTLARVAADLGIRSPSLYAHVDGLPDLRRRLAARGARELASALTAAAAGRARGDALRAIADVYRAYAREHRACTPRCSAWRTSATSPRPPSSSRP